MPILLPEPIIVAPEVKTYDGVWICSFIANFPSTNTGYLRIETKPFSTQIGEIYQTEPEIITTDQIWKLIEEVPQAAIAFNAVITSIPAIKQWIEEQKVQPIPESTPEPTPEPVVVEPLNTSKQIIEQPVNEPTNSEEKTTLGFWAKLWLWLKGEY